MSFLNGLHPKSEFLAVEAPSFSEFSTGSSMLAIRLPASHGISLRLVPPHLGFSLCDSTGGLIFQSCYQRLEIDLIAGKRSFPTGNDQEASCSKIQAYGIAMDSRHKTTPSVSKCSHYDAFTQDQSCGRYFSTLILLAHVNTPCPCKPPVHLTITNPRAGSPAARSSDWRPPSPLLVSHPPLPHPPRSSAGK